MKRAALIFVSLLAFATSSFALTANERKQLIQVQSLINQGQADYAQAKQEVAVADQRAADADAHAQASDTHAAETDQAIGIVKKQIDDAHNRELALKKDNDKMAPVYKRVMGPWFAPGLGAIIFGFERLAKFTLIFAAVVIVLVIAVVVIFPAVIPFLEAAGLAILRFLEFIGGFLSRGLRALGSLFKKIPAPTLPPAATGPTGPTA